MQKIRQAAGAMALAAAMPLGACTHIYEQDAKSRGVAVEDYIAHLDARPDDTRVHSLKSYASSFLGAMSVDVTNARRLRKAAVDMTQRKACLYESYGYLAKSHIDGITRIVVGDVSGNAQYIELIKAEQDVPAFQGDPCDY